MPLSSLADSTFDSGQGSTVYSDSQSSQQSVVLGSLVDAVPPTAQSVCSPPVSVSDGTALPRSLPSLGAYQPSVAVSQLSSRTRDPHAVCDGLSRLCWPVVSSWPCKSRPMGGPSLSVTAGLQAGAGCDLP